MTDPTPGASQEDEERGELADDSCEYGCDGPCETLDHWKDRAQHWANVAEEAWERLEPASEVERLTRERDDWRRECQMLHRQVVEAEEALSQTRSPSDAGLCERCRTHGTPIGHDSCDHPDCSAPDLPRSPSGNDDEQTRCKTCGSKNPNINGWDKPCYDPFHDSGNDDDG